MKNGLDVLVILLHYVFVVELLLYLLDALHVCVDDLAVLVAIAEWYVVAPANLMELEEEIQNVQRMQHVDEGKADGALGFEVHGQIEVVVLAHEVCVDELEHVTLEELDWDVLDHQGRQGHDVLVFFVDLLLVLIILTLASSKYFHQVYLIVLWPDEHLLLHLGVLDVLADFGDLASLEMVGHLPAGRLQLLIRVAETAHAERGKVRILVRRLWLVVRLQRWLDERRHLALLLHWEHAVGRLMLLILLVCQVGLHRRLHLVGRLLHLERQELLRHLGIQL